MITLFRRIRQKLIDSGSVAKYLLYAIGEILLVVIGILIALQVNNWNEERKVRNQEQYLLKELIKEFNTNLQMVKKDFEGNKKNLDAVIRVMDFFDQPVQDFQSEMDSLIVDIFASTSYDPTTGVVDEIISTGKLNVLRDDSLRYLISQWPSKIDDQMEDITIRRNHFEQFVLPALIRAYPMKNINPYFDFSFWTDSYQREALSRSQFAFEPDLFFTKEMEGILFVHSLNQDFVLMNDQEIEEYIEVILKRINTNLN